MVLAVLLQKDSGSIAGFRICPDGSSVSQPLEDSQSLVDDAVSFGSLYIKTG